MRESRARCATCGHPAHPHELEGTPIKGVRRKRGTCQECLRVFGRPFCTRYSPSTGPRHSGHHDRNRR